MKGGNDAEGADVNESDNDCVGPCSIPWVSCAPTTSILTPRGLKGRHGRSGSLRPPPPPICAGIVCCSCDIMKLWWLVVHITNSLTTKTKLQFLLQSIMLTPKTLSDNYQFFQIV